jgi:hypothetical protein
VHVLQYHIAFSRLDEHVPLADSAHKFDNVQQVLISVVAEVSHEPL